MANQREVTISLPEPVVQAATALAARESRTVGELLQELVTRYDDAVQWRELKQYGQERSEAAGVRTEEEVVKVCREIRAEQYVSEQLAKAGTLPE